MNTPLDFVSEESAALSSRLKRQMKRHLGIEDGALGVIALLESINQHYTPTCNTEKFFSGFIDFLTSIDESYSESDDKFRMALRNLEVSSNEQNSLNTSLEDLNRKINAMLDSLGQGLLFFDSQGICSSVFSRSCIDIFGTDPSEKFFTSIFSATDEQKDDFAMWLTIVFDDNVPVAFDDLKTLIPQEFTTSDGRFISLDYRPLRLSNSTKIDGILCISTDKTFEIHAKQDLQEKEEEALRIRMAASNRNEFQRFVQNFDDFLDFLLEQKKTLSDSTTLITALHNFKGISAVFHFRDLVKHIHDLENMVKSNDYNFFIDSIDRSTIFIQKQKNIAIDLGKLLFGEKFLTNNSVMMIDANRITEFRDALKSSGATTDILALYDTAFLTTPIQECFRAFQMELNRVAESQNKPHPSFSIVGGELPVIAKHYDDFFDSLMHLARNIVDHGIEAPELRESLFKHPFGEVEVLISKKENNTLMITIRDDGNGISIDAIKAKLKLLGLYDENAGETEILQRIFDADFSTRTDTSLLSGRGIGMYAVKQEVEKMGGVIYARNRSCNTCGAEFVIRIPMNDLL